jgi:O-antigen/teichoic acid export membrane protein
MLNVRTAVSSRLSGRLSAWVVLIFTAIASIVAGVLFSIYGDHDVLVVWLSVLGLCVVVMCMMAFLIDVNRGPRDVSPTS